MSFRIEQTNSMLAVTTVSIFNYCHNGCPP